MKNKINTIYNEFYQVLAQENLTLWLESLPLYMSNWIRNQTDKRFTTWLNTLDRIPKITPNSVDLKSGVIAKNNLALPNHENKIIKQALMSYSPWRKGPYDLYNLLVDAEWRSDLKWDRIKKHLSNLTNKKVLDVGCNSGYHLWRMLGLDAKLAVGIDPVDLFLVQFLAIKKLLGNNLPAYFVPIGIEQMPELKSFDVVFSMGVLYHRRSPLDHLYQLKNQLIDGGQLILETLVIKGDINQVLTPCERYAKMKNVYFIPSIEAMKLWLIKCGFKNIQIIDISTTTTDEQRKTDWMTSESLIDFLDPNDHTKTIEGYPAPMRAVFSAIKE